jgi:putative hydrolase of the HAD superfamily
MNDIDMANIEKEKKMAKIKTVIFDLDDTLYDYTKCDRAAKKELYGYCESRFGLSEKEAEDLQQEIFEKQEKEMPGRAASHNRLIRYQMMLEKLEKPLFPHALAMCNLYWNTFFDNLEIEPGAAELLRALKLYGIRVGCGTNMTTWVQYEKIRRLKLGPYINFMVTSEEAGAEKPALKFYTYLLEKAGCAPEECIFVGDNYRRDYEASNAAGFKGVWYAGHPRERDEKREAVFRTENRIDSYKDCLTKDGIRLGDFTIQAI